MVRVQLYRKTFISILTASLLGNLELSGIDQSAILIPDVIDIYSTTVLTQIQCSLFENVLGFVHFSAEKMIYLYRHSLLEILLNIECDVGGCRVWIQFYLFASIRGRHIT